MQLNNDQANAFEKVKHWLSGSEPYYFLSGQAGSGKTFLADRIKDWIRDNMKRVVYVTATTNKAAAVLTRSMDGEEATTIYSLLNLRVVTNFDNGKQSIQRIKNPSEQPVFGSIVIVDEASMIDPDTMDHINDAANYYGLRVLFLGDAYQLPPVNAGSMPVTASSIDSVHLTEIMRANKRLDLEDVYRAGREMVISDEGIYVPAPSENVSVISHLGSKDYLQSLLMQDPHTKVLAYTNAVVEGANKVCREMLHLPTLPAEGDLLVAEDIVIVNTQRLAYIGQEFYVDYVEEGDLTFNGESIPSQYIYTTCGERFLRANDPHARQACLKILANAKDWRSYYAMKEAVADLRFTHASTVHKSQGSTYENALVMVPDIMTCRNPSVRRRLLYVAYTRASKHLHIMVQ